MAIDDNIFIPQLCEGDKLFHYTSADGFKGICEGEIWATHGYFLNDPTEFQIGTEVFCEVVNMHVHNKEVCKKLKDNAKSDTELLKIASKDQGNGVYIISFSLDEDSTLMWSEYSDFLGYCLKFDFDKLYSSIETNHTVFLHGKVIYDREEQFKLIERTIEEGYFKNESIQNLNSWEDFNKITDKEIENLFHYLGYDIYIHNLFFKLQAFADENEYRFIFLDTSCKTQEPENIYNARITNDNQPLFRIKNEVIIPFIKVKYQCNALEEIMIGPKNKMDIALEGAEYFLKSRNLFIPVTKSKMPLRY